MGLSAHGARTNTVTASLCSASPEALQAPRLGEVKKKKAKQKKKQKEKERKHQATCERHASLECGSLAARFL